MLAARTQNVPVQQKLRTRCKLAKQIGCSTTKIIVLNGSITFDNILLSPPASYFGIPIQKDTRLSPAQ